MFSLFAVFDISFLVFCQCHCGAEYRLCCGTYFMILPLPIWYVYNHDNKDNVKNYFVIYRLYVRDWLQLGIKRRTKTTFHFMILNPSSITTCIKMKICYSCDYLPLWFIPLHSIILNYVKWSTNVVAAFSFFHLFSSIPTKHAIEMKFSLHF